MEFFFLKFLLNSRVVVNHFPSYQLLHIPYGISNEFREGIRQRKALESAVPKKDEKHVFRQTLEGYNSSYRPRYEIGPYFFLKTSSKHFVKKFIPLEVYIELTKAKHEEYDKEKS